MKNTARILYIIGIVTCSALVLTGLIMTLVGAITYNEVIKDDPQAEDAIVFLIIGLSLLGASVLGMIFSIVGLIGLNRESRGMARYVFAIIFGAVISIFTFIAGILSVVYISSLNNSNNNQN